MNIKKRDFLAASVGAGIGLAATSVVAQEGPEGNGGAATRPGVRAAGSRPVNSGVQPSSVDLNYKARRVNKVIELWEDGQPAYFVEFRPDAEH